jgi:hypothetical protein
VTVTLGLDGLTSLSKVSDHLGNLANVLKDLSGGAALLHELLQNADDAKADTVRFAATEAELTVCNSGDFTSCGYPRAEVCPWRDDRGRSCDLHSFRIFAGRHKSSDSATTGAFGVGFTSVYQVTDHPELVVGGSHLVLDEAAKTSKRIRICDGSCSRDHATRGTTFYLPWARENSLLRQQLSVDVLTDDAIASIVEQLHDNATDAAIFFGHVSNMEITGQGRQTAVTRKPDADRICLTVNGKAEDWLVLEGDADRAEALKGEYEQIDHDRSALVQVAVPVGSARIGRVYAGLPTETRTGWTGHINASFYPRQDRKGVEFGATGFRSLWNEMLVDTAADIMAGSLELIAEGLGYPAAWDYLAKIEQVNREVVQDKYPTCFATFFSRAKERVRTAQIALLANGEVTIPDSCVVPQNPEEYQASDVLVALDLPVIHPSIRSAVMQSSYTHYGIHLLNTSDIVDALLDHGLDTTWRSPGAVLTSDAEVDTLLTLLQRLHERGGKSGLAAAGAGQAAIVPCLDGSYAPPDEVSRLDGDDRTLFELLDPSVKVVDDARLGDLCRGLLGLCDEITPVRAIEIFERNHEALRDLHHEALDWLDDHRSALHDTQVQARVRELPIFPSSSGRPEPLSKLSLASTFEDVLGVADVVDRQQAAGHEDLLRLLGAQELDAVEYLTRHVIPRAEAGSLETALLGQILEIIYDERPALEADASARVLLSRAPLILCTDGEPRPATAVHIPNRALSLISPDEPVAELSKLPQHLVETLYWLGVSRTPNHRVLSDAALRLAEDDEDPSPDVVLAILDALPDPLPDAVPADLTRLVSEAWLPVEGGGRAVPADLYAVFQREIFESQGRKLALSRPDQNRRAGALEWLGVHRAPTTAMVIAHLRYCVRTGTRLNEQVYRALGDVKESQPVQAVRGLRGERCVQVSSGAFIESSFVFWTDPGLGRWAYQLPHEHRQYQSFFDRVGVTESPSPGQIEGVLRRISRSVGNDILDDGDRTVVHRCWELLDQQLSDQESRREAESVLTRLGPVRSALDARGMLEKPEMLLFIDGRRLAEKIELISNNLIRRDRTTQRALAAAGIRPAEDVIDTFVDSGIPSTPAMELRALVAERTPAILRLVESYRDEGLAYDAGRLKDIEFLTMPDLVIEYHVRFAHQVQVTDPEPAEAVFLDGKDQLLVRTEIPSRHLARELARCIEPEADVSAIAPSLHEILSAPTLGDAIEVLNEYGVRDLDEADWEHIATQLSIDHGDTVEDLDPRQPSSQAEGDTPGADFQGGEPDGHPDGVPSQADGGSGVGSSKARKRRSRSASGQRRAQMASYVSFNDDGGTDFDERGDEAAERSSVDAAGVRRVLEYEESRDRVPEEQARNNPGFDVLSRDANGNLLRKIEIKSIGGSWTGFGVWMSARQFAENETSGDDFWLYVVEHAEDDDAAVIHRIPNPARKATKFGFDAGWQALGEADVEVDDSG